PGGQQPARPRDGREGGQEHARGEARPQGFARAVRRPGDCALRPRRRARYALAAPGVARRAAGPAHRPDAGEGRTEPRLGPDGAAPDPLFHPPRWRPVAVMRARAPSPRLEVRPYRLPLSRPLWTAHGVHEVREGFVVMLHQDGRVGRGDAAPLPEL